ncbi:MAG: DUF3570 domain-containing protein [Thermoanaerobaculia bacterium]
MAAIERALRRARRRARKAARRPSLPLLAAGAGALAAHGAQAQSQIDARLLFYKESGGRTEVINPFVNVHRDLGDAWGTLDLLLGYDTISGASPTGGYPSVDVTTSASGHTQAAGSVPLSSYSDRRKSVSLAWGRKVGSHLPSIDVSYSKENDYTARSFGISDAWTFAGGRGTLHAGASFASDIVAPVTNNLELAKKEQGYALGWTWILTERDLFDVSASLMKQNGYLDDPYKVAPVGTSAPYTELPDHRPDTRQRWAVFGKYGHYYLWGGALKATYRYYWDDWSVRSHTLEVVYDHRWNEQWVFSPIVRLYTQTAASFWGNSFPVKQEFMSADYRLSALSSILGGLTATHKMSESVDVSLGFTYQSQTGKDPITVSTAASGRTPAGSATVSAADLTILTITAGFTWRY